MGKVLVVVTLGRRVCVIAEQDLLFVMDFIMKDLNIEI